MINPSYQAHDLGNKIWYFTNIYNDLNKVYNVFDQLPWESWNRYGKEVLPLGKAVSVSSDGSQADQLLNISKAIFSEYCKKNNYNDKEYSLSGSVHLRIWDAPNQGMPVHSDFTYKDSNQDKIYPEFTLSYYLTDDYEGGHIEFPESGISIKPEAGSVIIFPSSTLHGVTDLVSGNRINAQEYAFRGNNE
jgi:hypothetical protein